MGRRSTATRLNPANLLRSLNSKRQEEEAYHDPSESAITEKVDLVEKPLLSLPRVGRARRCVSLSAAEEARQDISSGVRRVSFARLEIRQYNVVMGDHPYCSQGCSLQLGWDYTDEPSQDVSEYEAHRKPRRQIHEMKLSPQERHDILLSEDYDGMELRKACRKHHRARSCVARIERRVQEDFFNGFSD